MTRHERGRITLRALVTGEVRFWLEYVFEAYASHRAEALFLMGLSDIPESRPHSRTKEGRHLLGVGG